jgi:hypothetical protein
MMSLIVNKKIKQTVLASLLICCLPVAQAWVTPVNMDADHEGSGGKFHRLSKTVGGETINLDRCDTRNDIYESVPTQCHRRNLVWQLGSKNGSDVAVPLAQWNPELGGDASWRLPTIKELSRLVDYSGITSDGEEALTGQPLIVNMFTKDNPEFLSSSPWLISSTYRDIDGGATNGQAQIFGINMGNGEIAAFDTVVSSTPAVAEEVSADAYVFIGNASESRDAGYEFSRTETYQNNMQVVVTEIVTSSTDNNDGTGTFTISGKAHTNKYPLSLEKCTAIDAAGVCTTSDVDVYALLVQTQTVSVLFRQP